MLLSNITMVLTTYYYLLLVGETTIAYRSSHIISNLHKQLELYMTIQSLPTSIENSFFERLELEQYGTIRNLPSSIENGSHKQLEQ
jgi:hypothetical protein